MAASRAGSRFHGTFREDMQRAAERRTMTRRLAATAGRSIVGGEAGQGKVEESGGTGEGDGSKPDSEWERHGRPRVWRPQPTPRRLQTPSPRGGRSTPHSPAAFLLGSCSEE